MSEKKASNDSDSKHLEIKLLDEASRFIRKVLGGTFIELGNITHDWASYFRLKNLMKIRDKVERLKSESGSNVQIPIPPRLAIPILTNASLEDEEALQDLWANLIAAGTSKQHSIHPAYSQILTQLCADEAIILKNIRSSEYYPHFGQNTIVGYEVSGNPEDSASFQGLREQFIEYCEDYELINHDSCGEYLDNLLRLNILQFTFDRIVGPVQKYSSNEKEKHQIWPSETHKQIIYEYLIVTPLGQRLIDICIV